MSPSLTSAVKDELSVTDGMLRKRAAGSSVACDHQLLNGQTLDDHQPWSFKDELHI